MDTAVDPAPRRRDPVLLAIVIVIAALVIIALVAVLTRGADNTLDPDSPEGVVQQYTSAMLDADDEAARELVDDDALAECGQSFDSPTDRDTRVTLRGVTENGSRATVSVAMGSGYDGGLFGGGTYEEEGDFSLIRSDDGWLITSTPWRFDLCSIEGS